MGIWAWSQRERKHHPMRYKLFVLNMTVIGAYFGRKKLKLHLLELWELGPPNFSEPVSVQHCSAMYNNVLYRSLHVGCKSWQTFFLKFDLWPLTLMGQMEGWQKCNLKIANLRIRAMHEANTALLDILVDNSVIIPSFERLFEQWKDGLLAELQAGMSRSCRFGCF